MGQMFNNFLHRSLWLVGLATVSLTAVIHGRKELEPKLIDITSYIFTVSGTFVALVLPGAELAGNLIARRLEYWTGELSKAGTDVEKQRATAGEAVGFFREMKNQAIPAWRGSLYVFCAFLVSALTLLAPHKFQTERYIISSGALLIGISLGFLLVGSFQFFPFAFYVYRLDLLDNTFTMFNEIANWTPPVPAVATSSSSTTTQPPGGPGGVPTGGSIDSAGGVTTGGGSATGISATGGNAEAVPTSSGTTTVPAGSGGGTTGAPSN